MAEIITFEGIDEKVIVLFPISLCGNWAVDMVFCSTIALGTIGRIQLMVDEKAELYAVF